MSPRLEGRVSLTTASPILERAFFRAGLTVTQVLILYGTTACVTGLVSLQFLDMI